MVFPIGISIFQGSICQVSWYLLGVVDLDDWFSFLGTGHVSLAQHILWIIFLWTKSEKWTCSLKGIKLSVCFFPVWLKFDLNCIGGWICFRFWLRLVKKIQRVGNRGEDHQVPTRNQIKPSRLNHRTLWFSSCRNLWYRHGILIGFCSIHIKKQKGWGSPSSQQWPDANDAYLVYTKPWGFPLETTGGWPVPGRSCWNSGATRARSARRAWRSSRRGPRFPSLFSIGFGFPSKQGFRLFFLIVLVCLSKNSTRGLIQGMEGGMIIKIGTDLETRREFGSSVIIRRKVYIVTPIIVPERSCRVRWAVLHNPMNHLFFG